MQNLTNSEKNTMQLMSSLKKLGLYNNCFVTRGNKDVVLVDLWKDFDTLSNIHGKS